MKLCEAAYRIPATTLNIEPDRLLRELTAWIRGRQREAGKHGTIAGAKYPQLARMGAELQ